MGTIPGITSVKDLYKGLVHGLKGAASKAAEMAHAAYNAAKKALDEHSPSKKAKTGTMVWPGIREWNLR